MASASILRSFPICPVQISPQHQAVAQATNQEGQQVDRGNDGKRGRPVTVVAVVEERRWRRGRGGEEVFIQHLYIHSCVLWVFFFFFFSHFKFTFKKKSRKKKGWLTYTAVKTLVSYKDSQKWNLNSRKSENYTE